MASEAFRKLIEDFCALTRIKDAGMLLKGGPLEVNDVVFSVLPSENLVGDLLFVYCDYGAPMKGREAEVHQALMEMNLMLYPLGGPMFSLSPETGRVIFLNRYVTSSLTPKSLGDILAHLAEKAKDWRTQQFLEVAPIKKSNSSAYALSRMRPDAGRS